MDKKKEDKGALEDLAGITLAKPMSKEDTEVLVEQGPGEVVVVSTPAKLTIKGATPESTKLKKKMLLGKKKDMTKEKLPDHIRKAYITIDDKKPNNPIDIRFSGVWTGSDINLAGKHLILDYNVYVRNRAIRGK